MTTDTTKTTDTTAPDPVRLLTEAMQQAIVAVLGDEYAGADPVIRQSQKPEFGDFQANGAMALAKRAKMNPRELAGQLIEALDVSAFAEAPEIAGPGFINIRLRPDALAEMVAAMDDKELGVVPMVDLHSVVIDLCAVNVAKQMHVGHLRSTIIGDALGRVFERLGRTVHRENHLGDWGLPIAMVLHQLLEYGTDLDALKLEDLDAAYRAAQQGGKGDAKGIEAGERLHAGPHRMIELEEQTAGAAEAIEAAKGTLLKLQQGDADLHRDWHKLIDCTLAALYEAVDLLNVKLGPENNRGESFYRDRLAGVIDDAVKSGVAKEDAGALVVHYPDRERPMIIRKSDGGFLYATTDLAACRFRTNELNANRVVYVVDARQRDHFRDVFDAVRQLKWNCTPDGTEAEFVHIGFGSVLGADKRPLKTRSGRNVTLSSLLEEARDRGASEVKLRAADAHAPTHDLSGDELDAIGRAVGIGAIKYADLSNDLVRDYVFDMDRMIAFEGDTGPYLQYAHARVCSILRKADRTTASLQNVAISLAEPAERQLALALLRYPGVVRDVARTLEPHRLCQFLYDLANAYSSFYQQCSVLKASDDATRDSRVRLCDLVRRVIADGLGLLGIEAPERM